MILLIHLWAIACFIFGSLKWGFWLTLGWTALGVVALLVAYVIGSLFTERGYVVTDLIGGPSYVSELPSDLQLVISKIVGTIVFFAVISGEAYIV